MIKKILGQLIALAVIAIIVLTILHRKNYQSMIFTSTEEAPTEEVSVEAAQPVDSLQQEAISPIDSLHTASQDSIQ